jgi:predicted porin
VIRNEENTRATSKLYWNDTDRGLSIIHTYKKKALHAVTQTLRGYEKKNEVDFGVTYRLSKHSHTYTSTSIIPSSSSTPTGDVSSGWWDFLVT